MTRAEAFDGNIQINRYDAEGLRAEMEEIGRLVQFIYNTSREVSAETEDHTVARYIRGSELIARSTDTESARTYYHYASDELGSVTHVTDEEGKVLNRYEYDAWGNLSLKEEQIPNRFYYAGEQLDPITQQYYLRARFYNPVLGRFLQEDTYRGDGLNLYAYCANNPVYYADPSGHWCTEKQNVYEKLVKAQGLDSNTIDPDTKLRLMAEAANSVKGNKETSNGETNFIAAPGGVVYTAKDYAKMTSFERPSTLYHYTTEQGLQGILNSLKMHPSIKTLTTNDARMGSGQYFTDIVPGSKTAGQTSRVLFGHPWSVKKVSNYIEIDASDLNILKGRDGVYYVPGDADLDLTNRLVGFGKVGG